MRRYQLSGLEHMHMMRHVPRSYDMTRTHILHKGVNRHVDVVLKCSPKNWKKKKVAVSVVRGEKKNDAARIRANAKKGYVAVRKVTNDTFEAERRAAATAFETNYGRKSAGSDTLIHDMKSQMASMAKKSADYIDSQLNAAPASDSAAANVLPQSGNTLISPETEKILKDGGYRIPGDRSWDVNPYAADYLKHASNEEFHILMNSLEKSLDEACKKYGVPPETAEVKTEIQAGAEPENPSGSSDGSQYYSNYTGSYKLPNDVSLSVTQKQEIKAEEKTEDLPPEPAEEFKPALTFTEGGEHYIPEDELFDRELHRAGEKYVPPAYLFDDDADDDDGGATVPMPDAVPAQPQSLSQDIFCTAEDDDSAQPFGFFSDDGQDEETFFPVEPDEEPDASADAAPDGYLHEDYEQQQVFFPTQQDDAHLYNPPQEEENFAQPTLYPESVETEDGAAEDYEPPMVFPDRGEDDVQPPMIFPDDEEDMPPPMIFPDEEDDGYSPAPVSPDRNEYFDGGADHQGVMDRSGQTFFSRTGDQIKKVIGVIRGSAGNTVRSKHADAPIPNQNVEITYSDRNRYNR